MTTHTAAQGERGRTAQWPREISWRGWWDVAQRIKTGVGDDYLSLVAAGVAFYALLAIFPALAAFVSLYGLVAEPGDVQRQLASLSGFLPGEALSVFKEQLSAVARQSSTALGLGAVASIGLALWSAARGARSLIMALNIVYHERETRGFFHFYALSLGLTCGAVLTLVVALALMIGLPVVFGYLGLRQVTEALLSVLRWPLLIVIAIAGLAIIYRYGPSRRSPRWRWVNWGSLMAALLWVLGSFLFSYYVSQFASYNKTYGSVGAVVILLMWLYLSAFIVLLGAKLNAELEHQTGEDSTVGQARPMGERGAFVADHLGEAR